MDLLTDVLRQVLEPHSFKRNRSGTQYSRTIDGVTQRVSLRKSRSGGDMAMDCSMGKPEDDATLDIQLSPVAPLKNTYWWAATLDDGETKLVRDQLERVALPFFAAHPAQFDESQARSQAHARLGGFSTCDPPFQRKDDSY